MDQLRRSGVVLSAAIRQQIINLVELRERAQATELLLGELERGSAVPARPRPAD